MKKRKIFYYLFLVTIALVIWFVPALFIVGYFKITYTMSKIVYYAGLYEIDVESNEPFKNLMIIVPTASYESKELIPKNVKTIKINNKSFIVLHRDKPYSAKLKGEKIYGMVFSLNLPKIRIENMSRYRICNSDEILIFIDFENASYVRTDHVNHVSKCRIISTEQRLTRS